MKKNHVLRISVFIFAMICFSAGQVYAVGSGVIENPAFSAKQIGENAVTADPYEPAAISYNPAGIVHLEGTQVQQNVSLIGGWSFYDDEAGNTIRYGATTPVAFPTGYITWNDEEFFDGDVSLGFGIDSPFGQSVKGESYTSVLEFVGFKGWLKMASFKPTVAVAVNDKLSIGGGPVYNYVLDYGAIVHYPNAAGGGPPTNGQARLNLDGDAWSWQMGALYQADEKHTFGTYFRSPFVTDLVGTAKVEDSAFLGIYETEARTKLEFPLNVTVAYAYKANDKSTYKIDLGYTRWSSIESRKVDFTSTVHPQDNLVLAALTPVSATDFETAISLQIGASHKINEKWTLRQGAFYYNTPVQDRNYSPITPDSHRFGLSGGFGYNFDSGTILDLTYGVAINPTRDVNGSTGGYDGKYFTHTHLLAASITKKF